MKYKKKYIRNLRRMIKSALKTGREMIYLDIYIFIYLRETMVVRLFNELMIFFFLIFH